MKRCPFRKFSGKNRTPFRFGLLSKLGIDDDAMMMQLGGIHTHLVCGAALQLASRHNMIEDDVGHHVPLRPLPPHIPPPSVRPE
jgi:hypothetical protein